MRKWEDRYKEKVDSLPKRLREDWETARKALRGECELDEKTLERWRKELGVR